MIIEKIDNYKNGYYLYDKEGRRGKKAKKKCFLRQCPYCRKASLYFRWHKGPRYAVTCPKCYASTDFFETKELAMNAPILK